jgi:small multidrug resistance pump
LSISPAVAIARHGFPNSRDSSARFAKGPTKMSIWQSAYDRLADHGWWLLAAAIVFEIAGTTCMKLSDGFSKLAPSVLLILFYLIAFSALTLCLKTIGMSIAYAIWAGVGTALAAIIGFFYFKEPASAMKVFCIVLILIGVVGLHYGESSGEKPEDVAARAVDRSANASGCRPT